MTPAYCVYNQRLFCTIDNNVYKLKFEIGIRYESYC
jgi:hypothetical protein